MSERLTTVWLTDGSRVDIRVGPQQSLDDAGRVAIDAVSEEDSTINGWTNDDRWVVIPGRSIRFVEISGFTPTEPEQDPS